MSSRVEGVSTTTSRYSSFQKRDAILVRTRQFSLTDPYMCEHASSLTHLRVEHHAARRRHALALRAALEPLARLARLARAVERQRRPSPPRARRVLVALRLLRRGVRRRCGALAVVAPLLVRLIPGSVQPPPPVQVEAGAVVVVLAAEERPGGRSHIFSPAADCKHGVVHWADM